MMMKKQQQQQQHNKTTTRTKGPTNAAPRSSVLMRVRQHGPKGVAIQSPLASRLPSAHRDKSGNLFVAAD